MKVVGWRPGRPTTRTRGRVPDDRWATRRGRRIRLSFSFSPEKRNARFRPFARYGKSHFMSTCYIKNHLPC